MRSRSAVPSISEFLYIDEDGLGSLYAQIDETTVANLTETRETGGTVSGALRPRAGMGLFLKLFGFTDSELSGEIGGGRQWRGSESTSRTVTAENKMAAVLNIMAQGDRVYRDLYSAQNFVRASQKQVFCDIEGWFRPIHWSASNDEWRIFANENGVLVLKSEADDTATVTMSLNKIAGVKYTKEISATGHLENKLRLDGRLNLRVFGMLARGGAVKPFAVLHL